jgi:hypothetical protein
MRMRTAMIAVAMAFGTTATWAGPITLTGTVGDAMCGVHHMVKGDDAKCTRMCVQGKADYALIVDGKAYTLKGDAAIREKLDKLANQRVTITGAGKGKVVDVASVRAAT